MNVLWTSEKNSVYQRSNSNICFNLCRNIYLKNWSSLEIILAKQKQLSAFRLINRISFQ